MNDIDRGQGVALLQKHGAVTQRQQPEVAKFRKLVKTIDSLANESVPVTEPLTFQRKLTSTAY